MNMYFDLGDQDCWDAHLAPKNRVPLDEETNAYLHSIERDLRSEITDLGPDTEAALPVWERLSRVQRLSGVVVAAMVGGDSAARQAAEFLASPRATNLPEQSMPPNDPFEDLLRQIAS